jgi:hypothetical protein
MHESWKFFLCKGNRICCYFDTIKNCVKFTSRQEVDKINVMQQETYSTKTKLLKKLLHFTFSME